MMSTQSSVPESLTRFKNLLLTGLPGCGKTTVLERVAEHLGDLRLAGILTWNFESMVSGSASRRLGSAGVVSFSLTSGFGLLFRWDATALSRIALFL